MSQEGRSPSHASRLSAQRSCAACQLPGFQADQAAWINLENDQDNLNEIIRLEKFHVYVLKTYGHRPPFFLPPNYDQFRRAHKKFRFEPRRVVRRTLAL